MVPRSCSGSEVCPGLPGLIGRKNDQFAIAEIDPHIARGHGVDRRQVERIEQPETVGNAVDLLGQVHIRVGKENFRHLIVSLSYGARRRV